LILSLADHEQLDGVHKRPIVKHAVQLFHVAVDADCEHDLTASEPARARALRLQLVEWLCAARGHGLVSSTKLDSAAAKGIAALGYAATGSLDLSGAWFDPGCACAECAKWR
jgi:hypothetical protein